MQLADIGNIFLSVLPLATFHYEASSEDSPDQYIIWAEDGQAGRVDADDKMQIQVITGTVDLFTRTEFDPLFDAIQREMNNSDMTWELNSTQYEEDTKYMHHEWTWEVDKAVG